MEVVILSSTILKPSSSSHSFYKTQIPLTIFDRAAGDSHIPFLFAFRSSLPTNAAMKQGLSKVLFHFPHLAGRLALDDQLRPCILINDAGVRVVETKVSANLAEIMPLEPSLNLTVLYPPFLGEQKLLQIQLNRLACGSLVVGVTAHQRVLDAQSLSSFLDAWSQCVRGHGVEPLPFHDRDAVLLPRNPPKCEFNHRVIEFRENSISAPISSSSSNTASIVVHYSAEFIKQLKSIVLDDNPNWRPSTFECVTAHIWKKITVTRGLKEHEFTQVRVSVNGRARLRPSVPTQYFGNLVLWAFPRLGASELLRESHGYAAKMIHDAVGAMDDRYFRSFIDFGELVRGEDMVASIDNEDETYLSTTLDVDSWLRFKFHELDFGGGRPSAFLPGWFPLEAWAAVYPSCKEKGGIDVFLTLSHQHVSRFKQVSHSLNGTCGRGNLSRM